MGALTRKSLNGRALVVAEMRAKWKMLRCKSLIGRALVVAEMRAKWEL